MFVYFGVNLQIRFHPKIQKITVELRRYINGCVTWAMSIHSHWFASLKKSFKLKASMLYCMIVFFCSKESNICNTMIMTLIWNGWVRFSGGKLHSMEFRFVLANAFFVIVKKENNSCDTYLLFICIDFSTGRSWSSI